MTAAQFKRDAQTMRDFRAMAERYFTARKVLSDSKGRYGVRAEQLKAAQDEFDTARHAVVSNEQRATYICNVHRASCVIQASPPPMLAGSAPSFEIKVFQGMYTADLPYGIVVRREMVFDAIDQAIASCERSAQNILDNPPSKWQQVGEVLKKVYNFLFRNEAQKSAVGWLLIAIGGAFALWIVGLNVVDALKWVLEIVKTLKG